MNLQRFQQILDAYGANPQRWPMAERAAAQAFLQQSVDAQALLDEAQNIDAMLDQLPDNVASLGLTQRIIALSQAQPQNNVLWQWVQRWLLGDTPAQQIWRPALILGLPLLLGVWLGVNMANQEQTRLEREAIAALAEAELQILLDQQRSQLNLERWLETEGDEAL